MLKRHILLEQRAKGLFGLTIKVEYGNVKHLARFDLELIFYSISLFVLFYSYFVQSVVYLAFAINHGH